MLGSFVVDQLFNDANPYAEPRKLISLGSSDFMIVSSNWHKVAVINFIDLTVHQLIDTGYNKIGDIALFPA